MQYNDVVIVVVVEERTVVVAVVSDIHFPVDDFVDSDIRHLDCYFDLMK